MTFLLLLALGLFDGVPAAEQSVARPILVSALTQLEEHYRTLGFVPTPEDRWPEVVDKLRAGRQSTWDSWRRELEWNSAALVAYPEACLRMQVTGPVQKNPAPVVWLEDARRILLGLDEDIPPEIAYGYQKVGPAWFFWMRTALEQAGAPAVAARLAALQPVKQHWFERQLEVYQALQQTVRSR